MTAGQFLGLGLVVPCDGGNKGLVLDLRFGDTAGRSEGGAAKQHDGVMQILQTLEQKAIVRSAVEMLVEDRLFPSMDFRVVGQLTMRIQHGLHHVDLGRVGEARTKRGRSTFEALAQIVKFG